MPARPSSAMIAANWTRTDARSAPGSDVTPQLAGARWPGTQIQTLLYHHAAARGLASMHGCSTRATSSCASSLARSKTTEVPGKGT
eukprot:628704-Rhodomonas_salina.1